MVRQVHLPLYEIYGVRGLWLWKVLQYLVLSRFGQILVIYEFVERWASQFQSSKRRAHQILEILAMTLLLASTRVLPALACSLFLVLVQLSLHPLYLSHPYRNLGQNPLGISPEQSSANNPVHNSLEELQSSDTGGVNQGATPNVAPEHAFPAALLQFTQCPRPANVFTNHIRFPNLLYNISMSPSDSAIVETRKFWNPTILALPDWAPNQYLIISHVLLKDQGYRQNVLCEARICVPKRQNSSGSHRNECSATDETLLGVHGGLRCVTNPVEIILSSAPANTCEGVEKGLADIPGFHDPRIFYGGRGEPVLMVVSQYEPYSINYILTNSLRSQYACIGPWAIDLRAVHPPLERIFSSSPNRLGPGPIMTYPSLTELTRNPPSTRKSYEKNWLTFSPTPSTSYIQYELSPTKRTIAQLIGSGLTTPNLTDPSEQPCLHDATPAEISRNKYMANATWHQATPSLKLILCARTNTTCRNADPETVFIAAIQRKHVNDWELPIRYERYLVLWSAKPPFRMLAVSKHPMLFANETTTGWTAEETWDDVPEAAEEGRGFWARLTYTTTIAWVWGRGEEDVRGLGTGFLDDEVVVSVGVDDEDQAFGRVVVADLLQCLRVCPGWV